jgi:hypothetical protein
MKQYSKLLAQTAQYYDVSDTYTRNLEMFSGRGASVFTENQSGIQMMQTRVTWHKKALEERNEQWIHFVQLAKLDDDDPVLLEDL